MEGNYQENLQILLNLIDDLVFKLDTNGCFTFINKNGALILNYLPEELINKHFLQFINIKEKSSLLKAFHEILSSANIITFEASFISKQGKEIIFEITGQSLSKNNQNIGMIATGKNVTKIRQLETELLNLKAKITEANRLLSIERARIHRQKIILNELNQLKTEFLSNISHELRTPLASIIGFSEAISSDPNISEEQKDEFNTVILNEGKKLAKLINEELDSTRVEENKAILTKIDFNLILLLDEIIHLSKQKALEKKITFSHELPDKKISINGDREKISKAFLVIIENALKYTNAGGRVKILCEEFDNEVEVIISDTGKGISQKELPVIFQKSYSKNQNSQPETAGLVFAKKIIDLHKGLLSVQSEEQKGSSFIIKLPKS